MTEPSKSRPWREPGSIQYLAFCAIALAAIWLVLIFERFGIWSLLPIAAGVLGAATRLGPILLALAVAMAVNFSPHQPFSGNTTILVPDLILSAAVLAYALGHYRLQAMMLHIFPEPKIAEDNNKEASSIVARDRSRRAPGLVTRQEITWALVSLAGAGLLGQWVWRKLPGGIGNPRFNPPEIWKAILFVWVVGGSMFLVASLLALWRYRQMTPQEAALLLEDLVWEDTRGEQRRIARWLTWAKIKRSKGESP
jgi:hypothetical protein